MSVWWGREQAERRPPAAGAAPQLVADERKALLDAVHARAPSFVPRWRGAGRDDDAGEAFARLFGDMASSLARRLNRLPDKARVELLRDAGVMPLLGSPATTLVQFEVSPAAPAPVFVGAGFRLGATAATGGGGLVEFETTEDLLASPGRLARALLRDGAFYEEVEVGDVTSPRGFLPFGDGTDKDGALLLGIASSIHPGRQLTLAFGVLPPDGRVTQSAGGRAPQGDTAVFGWDVLDGTRTRAASVISDGTAGLTRSGLVVLETPADWAPSRPDGQGDPLHWLRVRILSGEQTRSAALRYVLLNVTPAAASVTVRERVLEPLDGPEGARWRLPLAPVIPGTLRLEVDDPTAALSGDAPVTAWSEVADLASATEADRVYVLDHQDGIVTFGDGVHGMKLPVGYRHVHARRYRTASGAESAIDAGALTVMLGSAPFLIGVNNPLPASGGRPAESPEATVERGPRELRAGGHAVTVADYGLIAMQADGAHVTRAFGIAGHHPEMPGVALPGVVGVLVLGERRADGPPLPSEDELAAVAAFVRDRAPAGVEILVSSPRFHRVSADVALGVRPGADATQAVLGVIDALNTYFDPLAGGDDGGGWPLGGTIRHAALIRRLLSVDGVESIAQLTLTFDGRRGASCEDVIPSPTGLLWPGPHAVTPVRAGGAR